MRSRKCLRPFWWGAACTSRRRRKVWSNRAGGEAPLAETIASIGKTVHGGGRVSLYQFGTFSLRERKARPGRNPLTGATIKIASSKNLVFKASSAQKASKKK